MVVTASKGDFSISQDRIHGDALMPCFRCGVCCTRYEVSLSVVEVRRIADGLGITWGEFLNRYVDQRWPSAESFLLRQRVSDRDLHLILYNPVLLPHNELIG